MYFNKAWLSAVILGCLISSNLAAEFTQPAQRIISLAPSLTELVYSAGAGDNLVGVVNFSDYPPAAIQLANVGTYNEPNIEKIIELQPDLILAWRSGNTPQTLKRLEYLGFRLLIRDSQSLDEIPQLIEEIGALAGTSNVARQEAERLRSILAAERQRHQDTTPLSVFYQVWNQPLITIGGKQFISQALAVCGAQNSFADLETLAPHVSIESVILKNPDVILLGGFSHVQQQWLAEWKKYSLLKAVQTERIYTLNADQYQRPTARLIEGLAELCELLVDARHIP